MSAIREDVLKTALELSESDHLLRAAQRLDTVSDELPGWSACDPEFEAELERRAADGSPGVPWEAVKVQLRADLDS